MSAGGTWAWLFLQNLLEDPNKTSPLDRLEDELGAG